MRKTTLLSTLAIGATLAFATLSANAQDKGFYAGAGVGQSFVDEGRYDDHDTAKREHKEALNRGASVEHSA